MAYWNGQSIGIVNDAWGASLNLPPSAKAGDDGQLALFVLANSTFDTATAHLIAGGKADRAYGYEANKRPWITELGDVYLVCEPAKPAMGDVRVSTSYRQKTLTVSVVDTTLPPGATWRVVARPVGGRGAAFQATPTAVSTGTGVTLTSTWQASHLWTPDDPFLYDLTVTLVDQHGHVVDESLPTRFGFREVWVDGKILRLNGQPLRLRPRMSGSIFRSDLAGVRRAFAFLKAMGFNCIIRPPSMQSEEDETPFYDEYYDVADETGMLMVPYTPYGQVTGGQFGSAQTSVDDDLARYMNARVIARTANHASVIAYSGFGPGLSIKGNPYNANPDWYGIAPLNAADKANALAAKFLLSDGAISPTRDAAPAFVRIVKALAPDRPFLSHYDTGQADGWGTFDYFNWTPTDEWARWIAPWAANGVKPIGAWEHGLPYPNSFTSHGIPDGDAEPWATEYAAARLGPAAYAMESDAYAKSIEEAYRRGKPTYQLSDTLRELIALPSVQAVWAEQNARIYRAWRTYGVPMGIEPFGPADNYVKPDLLRQGNGTVVADPKQPLKTPGFKADAWCRDGNWLGEDAPALVPFDPKSLLPLGAALRRNNGPLLAYISGAASDIAAVDHVYRSGESVSKQVALVWDGFTMRALTVSVTAKCGARVAFAKTWTVRLAPGEIRMLPFSFTAPSIDGARADAEISLSVADAGASVASDRFSFAVYGPDPKVPAMQIVALDPDGSAATMLARLGVSAIKISRADDLRGKRFDCLVVGRRALVKLRDSDISALLPAGASVLVLEQTDRDLEALGFRAFPTRTRVVFPLPQSNPVLSGVATADLAEWRVRPSLYPATTGPLRDGYNWRGDAYGTVASAVIETPTRGDFTPLLHCEFDLAMTPVVQTHIGGHRWLFCQLSLPDGVGTDPVATRVAGNLLRWIRSREAAPPQLPVTVSGDGGDEVAKALGLEPSHANDPRGVAVVTSTPHDIPAFRAWVAGGGVAIVLPLANVTDYAVLGCKAVVTSPTTRLMPMPSDTGNPLWLGLGAGDFHLRAPSSVLCFDGSVLREQAEGRGKWIFVGFDPRRLDLAAEPYLRLTYRRQCRVLSQLIANCGGQFPAIDQALLSRLRAPAYTLDIGFWKEARIREQPAGGSTDWTALRFNDLNWARFDLAGKSTAFGHVQARFGFYASFAAPSRNLVLDAGTMDDFDRCWLNGVLIGSVNPANHDPETAWSQRRLYPIPDGLVKPGAHNVLAIEAWNRNADTKGWKAQIRGPLELRTATEPMSLYAGYYRHADDPYLQHHW
jgi:hypothetical protein